MILTDYKKLFKNHLVVSVVIIAGFMWLNLTLYKNTNNIRNELESITAQFSSIRTNTSDFKEMKSRHKKAAKAFKEQANIFKTEREYLKFVNAHLAAKHSKIMELKRKIVKIVILLFII